MRLLQRYSQISVDFFFQSRLLDSMELNAGNLVKRFGYKRSFVRPACSEAGGSSGIAPIPALTGSIGARVVDMYRFSLSQTT